MVRPTTSKGQTECMQPVASLNYPHWGLFTTGERTPYSARMVILID